MSRARVVAEKSSSAAVESAPRRATSLLRRHPWCWYYRGGPGASAVVYLRSDIFEM